VGKVGFEPTKPFLKNQVIKVGTTISLTSPNQKSTTFVITEALSGSPV